MEYRTTRTFTPENVFEMTLEDARTLIEAHASYEKLNLNPRKIPECLTHLVFPGGGRRPEILTVLQAAKDKLSRSLSGGDTPVTETTTEDGHHKSHDNQNVERKRYVERKQYCVVFEVDVVSANKAMAASEALRIIRENGYFCSVRESDEIAGKPYNMARTDWAAEVLPGVSLETFLSHIDAGERVMAYVTMEFDKVLNSGGAKVFPQKLLAAIRAESPALDRLFQGHEGRPGSYMEVSDYWLTSDASTSLEGVKSVTFKVALQFNDAAAVNCITFERLEECFKNQGQEYRFGGSSESPQKNAEMPEYPY